MLGSSIVAASMVRDSHIVLGWSWVFANAFVGLWALVAHYRSAWRRRELWWAIGVAQLLVFAQAIVGVVILDTEDIEPPEFHLLYGFSGIVAIGIVYSYRSQMEDHRYLLYAGGSLFLMGLGIRALLLGPT